MSTASERLTGPPETGEGTAPGQFARETFRKLVAIYLKGSITSVVVVFFLFVLGIEFTPRQWELVAAATPFVVAFYVLIDVAIMARQYRPLGHALRLIDAGKRPTNTEASAALMCSLNLPSFAFNRITLIHGPAAAVGIVIALAAINRFFDAGVAGWQIATCAAIAFLFASPAHAIFEYFSISRDIERVVEKLWAYCDAMESEHEKKLYAIRLKNKLLYLSIFVAALPLFFFAFSILFKVGNLFADFGIEFQFEAMLPLFQWVVGVVFVCILGALLMSVWTANEVSRSAGTLIGAMREVATGRLDNTLKITVTDEYAELYRGFNLMTESLREEVRILELSHDLAGELNLDTLLGRIIGATTQLLDADRSTLFLYDRKTDQLYARLAEGVSSYEIRFYAGVGVAGAVFRTGEAAYVEDGYTDPRFNADIDVRTGYKTNTILAVPIANKAGERIGVTQVLNKRSGMFTKRDEIRLRAFTAQIAVALENAKLFEDVLNEKNYTDSILKSTSNGILTIDTDFKVLTANDGALAILKRRREDMVGANALERFSRDNPWVVASLRRVAETGRSEIVVDHDLALPTGKPASINLSVAPLLDAANTALGSMLVLEDISDEKRIKSTMARYLSPEIADQMMASGEAELGGKSQAVSILFADIRNFTTVSEALGARETVAMLNEYFEQMVDVIFGRRGVLDKFIGDAIMALFGVPFNTPLDADNAVATANQMLVTLRALNTRRVAAGRDPIDIGIGISTGEVVVGNIGSAKRMEYTVIGDSVNLASRVEGVTKYYGAKLLISDFTRRALKTPVKVRDIDLIRVKGKTEPVALYEALDHHTAETFPRMAETLDAFAAGLTAFRRRDFSQARTRFAAALAACGTDRPSEIYLERCDHYLDHPPPADWDGVWTMTEK